MGVFGEKHTSLTREQKRQLIYQADTHKLRPTEVCDWVLATWGLRIARVTVYSILHKQRASLMAGHKDLYQSLHNNSGSSSSFTNTNQSAEDACLELNKGTGRINKYQANSKRVGGDGCSSTSDLPPPMSFCGSGEGARWEGQLKRVREPASVELDRAMVIFLKSSAAVDAHGRRLNDAELQSHALRLARGIPSASRMRCSFGWLRHFKRRLGVQWVADRFGRYRWIIEMDPFGSDNADADGEGSSISETSTGVSGAALSAEIPGSAPASAASDTPAVPAHIYAPQGFCHTNTSSGRQGKIKREHDDNTSRSTQAHATPEELTGDEDDDEYHSSQELLGNDYELTGSSAMHSTSTSTGVFPYDSAINLGPTRRMDLHQLQQQSPQPLPHRHFSFSESSSFSLGPFSSSLPQPVNVPTTSLAHPSQSAFLTLHPSTSQSPVQSSILDSLPSLFDSLPPVNNIPASVPSSQILLNNTSMGGLNTDTTSMAGLSTKLSTSQLGMGVDGGMRKVPSKDEAYEMLQSLLLYYEQDHHHIGEQQTLLLPRWIHQQRQVMHQPNENDPRMMWMRQSIAHTQNQHQSHTSSNPFSSSLPTSFMSQQSFSVTSPQHHPLPTQPLYHSHSSFSQTHRSASLSSSPPLSPLLSASPTPSAITSSPLCGTIVSRGPAGLDNFNVSSAFPSLTSSIEQQMFFAHHHALQQQFALQQQHQQQQSFFTQQSPSHQL
ncbi:hypothetical protein BGZ65_009942 [Modicella reniformis]|uniref:HTH CENPB-type domain-containing protein n=1 Tax=Modicella reniformis TaxID=1440133 RepID=A0A9P6SPX2_9FUNG|nr:hypothetical protein BGZ65_009942 [Modicella reniformis]